MNTDLNDYPNDNYEKYSIHEVDDKSIVIIDDPEALQKDRIIQLIKTHKDEKIFIYVIHPDKSNLTKLITDLYMMH